MQIPPITVEAAAEQFKKWRQSKTSKFDPIPNNLKILIKQLIPHYSKTQIVKYLKLNSAIIKPYFSNDPNYNSELNINFVPFQIAPTTNQNNSVILPKHGQSICQIIKPNGTKLVIQTSDPKSIVQAFICCN